METPVRLFRVDVSMYQVQFEDRADGRYAVGLPLMKPGKWNGTEYTASDLEGVAKSFGVLRDTDAFTPALKPYHTYDAHGQPIMFDPRNTLGRWSDLRIDPERGGLVGDAKLLDASTEQDILSGKLRYLSAELWPGYRLAGTGETVALAFVGAAFVDNPGVKGMPWEVLVNSADFPAQRKGAENMAWFDGVKALLGKLGASAEDIAALGEPEQAEGGVVQTQDAKPDPEPVEVPEVVKRQLAMLQETVQAQGAQLARQAEQARLDRAQGLVETLCAEGYLPPAQKPLAFALAERLLADEAPVKLLSADGNTEDKPLVEVFAALLRGSGKRVEPGPRGLAFLGDIDPQKPSPIDDKLADELVAAVGGGGE